MGAWDQVLAGRIAVVRAHCGLFPPLTPNPEKAGGGGSKHTIGLPLPAPDYPPHSSSGPRTAVRKARGQRKEFLCCAGAHAGAGDWKRMSSVVSTSLFALSFSKALLLVFVGWLQVVLAVVL